MTCNISSLTWYSRSALDYYSILDQSIIGYVDEGSSKIQVSGVGPVSKNGFGTCNLPFVINHDSDFSIGDAPPGEYRLSHIDGLEEERLPAWASLLASEQVEYIDLGRSEVELRKRLRKSYKSLVNKQDGVECVPPSRVCEVMSDCRVLHAEVAERVTRSDNSWDAMAEAVRSGEGLLITLSLNQELCGYCFFFKNDVSAYYASSAMRDRKGAHPLIWRAVLELRKNKVKFLVMDYFGAGALMTDKERAIRHFKSGFGLLSLPICRLGAERLW